MSGVLLTPRNRNTLDASLDHRTIGKAPAPLIRNSTFSDENTQWSVVLDGRILRVFMSSTFRDMQRERDEFFANAEKVLKRFATERGVVLVFVDLRWGLTSDISNNGLVVISCLESIGECPYFLCTLGSRYGWCPDYNNPKEWHPDTDVKFPYLKDIRSLSVTDYEIIHGALKDKCVARRAFFYSRDEQYAVDHVAQSEDEKLLYRPANTEDGLKQQELKKKIAAKFQVKPYRTPKELVEMILDDLMVSIESDFPRKNLNAEDVAHDQFMRHRLIGFQGRDATLDLLKKRAKQQLELGDASITIVAAEAGIGKSSVMSGFVRDLINEKGSNILVIYHFVGCSNMSNYVDSMIERVARLLIQGGLLPFDVDSEQAKALIKRGLGAILEEASKNGNKRVVLAIDGFNQFLNSQSHSHVYRLEWLPKKTPKNIAIVASTIETHISCQVARSFELEIVPVGKLDGEGIKQATNAFLARYNKTLSESQLKKISEDSEDTGHPLYLRIVLDELRVFGVYEKVDAELDELLRTRGVVSLFDLVMNRWENKYGVDIVRHSISVLYLSRIGLNENELDAYMEHRLHVVNHSTWKSFLFVLLDSLFVRNGRYSFFHQLLTQSINEKYFKDPAYIQNESKEYGLWLLKEYGSQTKDESEMAEICHNLKVSKEYKTLYDYISTRKVTESLLGGVYRFEFFEYWRELNSNGYDHTFAYGEMAKQPDSLGAALVGYFQDIQENKFLVTVIQDKIEKDKNGQHRCDSLHELGVAQMNLGKLEEARVALKESISIREKSGLKDLKLAETYDNLGTVYYKMGRNPDAIQNLDKSLKMKKKLTKEADKNSDVAKSYRYIGDVQYETGKHEDAFNNYQKSLQIFRRVYGYSHPEVALTYSRIALMYRNVGKYEEAMEYLQKSLEIQTKIYGGLHPNVAALYNDMGHVYRGLGNQEKAWEHFQMSLAIELKIFDELHPDLANSYMGIGGVYRNVGRYKSALDCYQKSLTTRMGVSGEKHPGVATTYCEIGQVYDNIDKSDDAMLYYQKALTIRRELYPETNENHPDIATVYNLIGHLYLKQGRYEEALKNFQRSLEIRMVVFRQAPHPDIAASHKSISYVYEHQKKYDDALSSMRKARDILKKFHESPYHPETNEAERRLSSLKEKKEGKFKDTPENENEAKNEAARSKCVIQ